VNPELPRDLLAPLIDEVALPGCAARLQDAVAQHARSHDILMRLREFRLEYSPTYIEPLAALRWIESGGRSVE
jgi:hypothetical protein